MMIPRFIKIKSNLGRKAARALRKQAEYDEYWFSTGQPTPKSFLRTDMRNTYEILDCNDDPDSVAKRMMNFAGKIFAYEIIYSEFLER